MIYKNKKVFLISAENLELARAEVTALTKAKDFFFDDRIILLNTDKTDFSRLAYTNKVYDLLFITDKKRVLTDFQKYSWNRIYKENFSLRIKNFGDADFLLTEKELAGYVWRSVKDPEIDLSYAKTRIEVVITKKNIYCCRLIQELAKDFECRKAHLRPGFSVGSLHPKLARCLVNLTGIEKGKIVDTCCGTGGMLIEAGLIGLSVIGYDINEDTLKKCETNLKYYKIKKYELINKDALKIRKKYRYIVTDLPYGLGVHADKDFYINFLKNLRKILTGKAVIVFSDKIDYKNLIKEAGLKLEKEFSYYIHKSLTKKITLIS